MLAQRLNSKSVTGPCTGSKTTSTGLVVLMLMSLVLLLPVAVHADALFDFQMNQAKKGNAEAQFKVGEMYETGFGVEQDKQQAMNWITQAADQGHETAGFKLLYWDVEKNGVNGGNKDRITALKNKAAEGNAQAQYYVGKMYSHGIGVKQDYDIAIGWLNKAALTGVQEAERELNRVRYDRQSSVQSRKQLEEKKRAELKLKQERERKQRLEKEQQRKLQQQKQAEAKAKAKAKSDAEAKARAEKAAKQKKAAEEAEARKRQLRKQAEQKQLEAKKQALLKQKQAEKKKRVQQFESDPCSGKSARFLSTCK